MAKHDYAYDVQLVDLLSGRRPMVVWPKPDSGRKDDYAVGAAEIGKMCHVRPGGATDSEIS